VINKYNSIENEELQLSALGPIMFQDNLFKIAWRGRWLIAASVVICLGIAFGYLLKATPIFTSMSRIYVEQSGPRIIQQAEGVMTQSKNYLYTQAELLKSTPILASALEKPGVKQMEIFRKVDNPIVFLKKKGLDVSVGKKDDIISISNDSPEPAEAAKLVNAVIDSYVTYHSTQKRTTSAEVLKILQKEKEKRDIEFMDKLKTMMEFKKDNIALAFENRNSNIILDRLSSLSEAVTQAQLQTIEAKSIYEITQSMVSDPTKLKQLVQAERARGIYITGQNESSRLKAELDKLELQLTDLTHRLTTDHPAARAMQQKIDQVKDQIAEMDNQFAEAQLAVARQQYLACKERETEVSAYFMEQRQKAIDMNEQLAQYTILQSGWEQTKKLCDILDDRIKELNITEDVGALNISILEVARPAGNPSKPQKARIMAMALVFGLMLGGGLALLRDWMDQKLRSPEEINAVLGIPVLGSVPLMSRKQSICDRGQKVLLESDSPAAEAYRSIRTAVFFSVPNGRAKTVLVTSPAASDGKTTLVSNLAITMAQAGQKTLILDADLRKPMQHEIFGVDCDSGLTDVLASKASLKDAIHSTPVKNLDILTTGPDVPNPSEMLNSTAFTRTLAELAANYDRVIIDSPPVMPVTDARIIAALCNVTVLVLRAEESTRKASQQARDGLLSVGAQLLGAVVNEVSKRNGQYGYYAGYGYGHYGRSRNENKTAKTYSEKTSSES